MLYQQQLHGRCDRRRDWVIACRVGHLKTGKGDRCRNNPRTKIPAGGERYGRPLLALGQESRLVVFDVVNADDGSFLKPDNPHSIALAVFNIGLNSKRAT